MMKCPYCRDGWIAEPTIGDIYKATEKAVEIKRAIERERETWHPPLVETYGDPITSTTYTTWTGKWETPTKAYWDASYFC